LLKTKVFGIFFRGEKALASTETLVRLAKLLSPKLEKFPYKMTHWPGDSELTAIW